MRRPKPRKRLEELRSLAEYEKQIKVDEQMRALWFRNVHTKDETAELIKFYCREVGAIANSSIGEENINKIISIMGRMIFLAKGMK